MIADWQITPLATNDSLHQLQDVLYGNIDYTFTDQISTGIDPITITWKISFYNSDGKEVYFELLQSKFYFQFTFAGMAIDNSIHCDFIDLKKTLFMFAWELQQRLLSENPAFILEFKVELFTCEILERLILAN